MAGIIIRARATHTESEKPPSVRANERARTHNSSVFKTASYFPQTPASRQTLIRLSRPQSQFAPLEIKLFWRRRLCFRFVCSCSRASIPPANYNFLLLSSSECGQMESHTPRLSFSCWRAWILGKTEFRSISRYSSASFNPFFLTTDISLLRIRLD